MNLRISQIFGPTLQGEGMYIGTPSIFIRFFGCNLDCAGFGQKNPMDPSTYEKNEIQHITSLSQYKVPKYGCDTSYAKDPEFKHLMVSMTPLQIARKCLDLVGGHFKNKIHLVITGGEPLWQQDGICEILECLRHYGLSNVTIETNGTVFPKQRLHDLSQLMEIMLSVSPKLFCCSGVPNEKAIRPDVLNFMFDTFKKGQLKFVCGNNEQVWEEVKKVLEELNCNHYPVYIMPVGSDLAQVQYNSPIVAEKCIREGYKFSTRLHVYLWGNSIDT